MSLNIAYFLYWVLFSISPAQAELTAIREYGGTFNTEPCLVGNPTTGICDIHTGRDFSGAKSIIKSIEDDINRAHGSNGHFERVDDSLDQIWAYHQDRTENQPLQAMVRTRYASQALKFGFIRGANPSSNFEILFESNPNVKQKLILTDCSDYRPMLVDGSIRCAKNAENFARVLQIKNGEEFQFAIRLTTDMIENLGPSIANLGAKLISKTMSSDRAKSLGLDDSNYPIYSSLPAANPKQRDLMVTFRFSETIRTGSDEVPTTRYLIAFQGDPNTEHYDYNDYVVEIVFASPQN